MTRVLVTGGTGLIGRHAVATLVAAGAEVHVAARGTPSAALPEAAAVHRLNLLDRTATAALVRRVRPSHLLHLAWVTAHGTYWRTADNLDWLAASLLLARAFAECGGRRVVAAGSCAEYDWSDPALITGDCRDDTTPIRPHTLYGATKDACRRALAAFADATGLAFAWGRVFLLFDPAEDRRRLVASIITQLGAGRRAACSSGTQVRDFLAAADVGAAFAALTLSDVGGEVNIGSGEARTIAEVAQTIGSLMGRADLIGLGDLPMRPDDPPRLVADVRRLRQEVGFCPQLNLDARIEDCIRALAARSAGEAESFLNTSAPNFE